MLTAARNLARASLRGGTRSVNLLRKRVRTWSRSGARSWKIGRERTRNGARAAWNLGARAGRRTLAIWKVPLRAWRRYDRDREIRAAIKAERRIEQRVVRIASRRRPLVLGPWFSEVGFEVLYWIPFLHWLKAQSNWDPAQVVAMSRGGVRSWYHGLADTYVELFDYLDPPSFARRNQERRDASDGSHKQLAIAALDRELLDHAARTAGLGDYDVVHPSDMYRLFRNFWLGNRSIGYLQEHMRFALRAAPSGFDLTSLPAAYVAVKAYTAQSMPDTPANRALLQGLTRALADTIDIVVLDTGLAIDDHEDYRLAGHPRVHTLAGLMTPQNNLELQTAVIANARAYVGTCGSLTWMAPFLGIDTVALMSDSRFLHPHLYVARQAYLATGAASFATVDVNAAGILGLEMAALAIRQRTTA